MGKACTLEITLRVNLFGLRHNKGVPRADERTPFTIEELRLAAHVPEEIGILCFISGRL